jgi:hypothetical protein
MGIIFPDLISEDQLAERFGVTPRSIVERARARGLGRKIGKQKRWFTESEALALWDSNFPNGQGRRSSTSGARSTDEIFSRLQKRETKRMLDDLRKPSKSGSQGAKNVTPLRSRKPQHST